MAIIQARMGARRFPGKVLEDLQGKPVLRRVLDRLRRARTLDETVVATTVANDDDRIARLCRQWGIPCFRGSEDDVLGRFATCAAAYEAEWIVRVNADNPLVDPAYVDALLEDTCAARPDYASYRRRDGTPAMLSGVSFFAEALSRTCLDRADRTIRDAFQREHVTLGIYDRPEEYRLRWLPVPGACEDARLRFTIDTVEDLEVLRRVWSALGSGAETASAEEVVEEVRLHPEWLETMADLNARNPKRGTSEHLGQGG